MNKIYIRVFEAFAGYGSQSLALNLLSILYPFFTFIIVGISEIDKWAVKAYKILHGNKIKNYGDITKINWDKVPDFNLFTYSFPCTNISQAGNQEGFTEGSGTPSSLLWECKKAILAKMPQYLLMENVKEITTKKFESDLNKWKSFLENLGYKNFEQVLDARNFGIPQHRERYFLVSILNEEDFEFPESQKLNLRAADILEQNVSKKFYLDFKQAS